MNYRSAAIGVALVVCGLSVRSAHGCPFCSAVSQTFGEEIATMDVVVITKLVEAPEETDPNDDGLGSRPLGHWWDGQPFDRGADRRFD